MTGLSEIGNRVNWQRWLLRNGIVLVVAVALAGGSGWLALLLQWGGDDAGAGFVVVMAAVAGSVAVLSLVCQVLLLTVYVLQSSESIRRGMIGGLSDDAEPVTDDLPADNVSAVEVDEEPLRRR